MGVLKRLHHDMAAVASILAKRRWDRKIDDQGHVKKQSRTLQCVGQNDNEVDMVGLGVSESLCVVFASYAPTIPRSIGVGPSSR